MSGYRVIRALGWLPLPTILTPLVLYRPTVDLELQDITSGLPAIQHIALAFVIPDLYRMHTLAPRLQHILAQTTLQR